MNCRFCGKPLSHNFLDLGYAPPSNAYLSAGDLNKQEIYYALRVKVCTNCWLVQTEDYAVAEELFSGDYAYFSSTSSSWLEHASDYSQHIIHYLGLNAGSFVVEIASNDGYLLRNFVEAGIPCLGIEPTASTAEAAEKLGVPVLRRFFGEALAQELSNDGKQADLIIGNNVYAHVPDINDFTRGMKLLLKPDGAITLEFPHLMRLIEKTQFDTVYHEHFSYLSLTAVTHIFAKNGLSVFDVEELPTHGGSLRVYGQRKDTGSQHESRRVAELLAREAAAGMTTPAYYAGFQKKVDDVKNNLLAFLIEAKRNGKKVAGYGAAAKGNTILNYAGVRPDLLSYVVDKNPAKQGKFLPGSHIPIVSEEHLRGHRPDIVLIFPWNIKDEIISQLAYIRNWGGQFVTAIPSLEIF
jgi:SAM-dependent methyltransferase